MTDAKPIPALFDPICQRPPDQIEEYRVFADAEGITPDEFVWREEGTLDRASGQFLCTACYMKAGSPTKPFHQGGWTATTENLGRDVFGLPEGTRYA